MWIDWLARRSNVRFASTSNLSKPAYPIKHILANLDEYSNSVQQRGVLFPGQVTDIVQVYGQLQDLQRERQHSATNQNRIVKEIKQTVTRLGQKDVMPNDSLKQISAEAKKELKRLDSALTETLTKLDKLLDAVPNLVAPSSAAIDVKEDFVVIRQTSDKLVDDKTRDHVPIGIKKNILDIESASRVSGTGNVFLTGKGALLEHALVQYTLKRCMEFGFNIISPPTLIRPEFLAACGFKPRDDDETTHIYQLENPTLCLSGTAEIPLASQMAQKKLDKLPLMHCGLSRCFRKEAGSRGADTRGLYRLHEFTKVEMFVWTEPTESDNMLNKLVEWQMSLFTEILGDLCVPLRIINVSPRDLGAPAYQKYDIEAWMPSRGSWGEISSASNCLDYQSRRLHTTDAEGNFVHTLNGTALAVPRVVLAIIENGYDEKTGDITVPKVLEPYLGGTI